MDKYYPIEVSEKLPPLRKIKIRNEISKEILTGFGAFAIIYKHTLDLIKKHDLAPLPALPANCQPIEILGNNELILPVFDKTIEFIHFRPERIAKWLKLRNATKKEPWFGAIYENINGVTNLLSSEEPLVNSEEPDINSVNSEDTINIIIYSTKNRLITINEVIVEDKKFLIVNAQGLLRHFIGMYNASVTKRLRTLYSSYYLSLLKMIRHVENELVAKNIDIYSLNSPLFLSIYSFGNTNESLAYSITKNMLRHDLGLDELMPTPPNYKPIKERPEFDYESNEFFRESGKIIEKNINFD